MPRLSISLSQDRYDKVENMVDDGLVKSKSKAVNKLISRGEKAEHLQEKIESLKHQLDNQAREYEQEISTLENRLEESRQREIARDNTNQEIAQLRENLEQQNQSDDAPFFVRWYRWYQNR